jgi:hypothetical protein
MAKILSAPLPRDRAAALGARSSPGRRGRSAHPRGSGAGHGGALLARRAGDRCRDRSLRPRTRPFLSAVGLRATRGTELHRRCSCARALPGPAKRSVDADASRVAQGRPRPEKVARTHQSSAGRNASDPPRCGAAGPERQSAAPLGTWNGRRDRRRAQERSLRGEGECHARPRRGDRGARAQARRLHTGRGRQREADPAVRHAQGYGEDPREARGPTAPPRPADERPRRGDARQATRRARRPGSVNPPARLRPRRPCATRAGPRTGSPSVLRRSSRSCCRSARGAWRGARATSD